MINRPMRTRQLHHSLIDSGPQPAVLDIEQERLINTQTIICEQSIMPQNIEGHSETKGTGLECTSRTPTKSILATGGQPNDSILMDVQRRPPNLDNDFTSWSNLLRSLLADKATGRSILRKKGESAQQIIDLLQRVLDYPQLAAPLKRRLLVLLLRLSRKSGLYPKCFTLKQVERGESPMTAGHFGDIWKGKFQSRNVCLKIIKMYEKSRVDHLLAAFSREAIVWGHVSHPNLLPFYGIYHLEDAYGRLCLVSPWMENGNVNEYLERNLNADRLLLVSDVIKGVLYLHDCEIVHGDLKGVNILVGDAGRACVADFGLSAVIDADTMKWTSTESSLHLGGTVRWQAPELITEGEDCFRPTKASDIYAFSCVCYEILTGLLPFYEVLRESTVIYKVTVLGQRPSRPSPKSTHRHIPDLLWLLMEDCWDKIPTERPTARQVATCLFNDIVTDSRPDHDWGGLLPSKLRQAIQLDSDLVCIDVLADLVRAVLTP
ncbi:kinase-like domain-containing protein [Crucibulum laeve]|uniref:Kinase-like domain-containing protein n=1 Tax=Crucibulum laeve TaxID=68775 RepID=A0A5C3MAU8_9AGAR|nr:kinase-like domain-containing protein [Crucibulum laeve]